VGASVEPADVVCSATEVIGVIEVVGFTAVVGVMEVVGVWGVLVVVVMVSSMEAACMIVILITIHDIVAIRHSAFLVKITYCLTESGSLSVIGHAQQE
jgi:hypothetical protein